MLCIYKIAFSGKSFIEDHEAVCTTRKKNHDCLFARGRKITQSLLQQKNVKS